MNRLMLGALALVSFPACSLFADDEPVTNEYADDGSLCWSDGALMFQFDLCLSSSCDTLIEASCTNSYADGVLTLSTNAVVESQGNECTADCGLVEAECADLPLIEDPDTVTVVVGEDEVLMADIPDCMW